MQDDRKPKLIKLSAETEKLLQEACKVEHRNMTNMIEHIILKYFGK